MIHGWAGSQIMVDLSRGNIEKQESDPDLTRLYLGGRGTCTRMFWDQVPPEVAPFSPENRLIFGTGVLAGTPAPAANRTILVTRSPQTNLLTYSNMGGFFGPELKYAGYDELIIRGRSPDPVYLSISNKRVEIRDARKLWGKTVKETQRAIWDELNDRGFQILCIGLAGENKAFAASIEHATGTSLSRSGVGAILGDKNLKAVAVRGDREVNIARPSEFFDLCRSIIGRTEKVKAFVDNWSFERAGLLEKAQFGNLEGFVKVEDIGGMHESFLKKHRVRQISCFNCMIQCKHSIRLADGEDSCVKCCNWYSFMAACKIVDLNFGIQCYRLCEEYGFDALSTARLIAFAIELFEKGILTGADTDGVTLRYGDRDLAYDLIGKIARREGLGDLLAHGTYGAARLIGQGAEDFAYHVKKLEIPNYPLHHPYLNLVQCVEDRADMLKLISVVPQHYLQKSKEEKEAYIQEECWPYPEDYKVLLGEEFDKTGADYERVTKMVSFDSDANTMADISGVCKFWMGFWPHNPYRFQDMVKAVALATGMPIDESEAMTACKRVGALQRSYNVALGIRRKDDAPPERFFKEPSRPPVFPAIDRNIFGKTIDEYYRLRRYTGDGVPSKELLDGLGLSDVRQELQKRGVL